MRSHRLVALCGMLCSLVIAAPIAALAAVERAVAFAFHWLAPPTERRHVVVNVVTAPTVTAGSALGAALLNSMRHEAGMRRLHAG